MKEFITKNFKYILFAVCLVWMANKDDVEHGRSSYDVNWCDTVHVDAISHFDGKRFRIKNPTLDTIIWLKVVLSDGPDTIRFPFLPGWNPEVVTRIVKDVANTKTIIYIGK